MQHMLQMMVEFSFKNNGLFDTLSVLHVLIVLPVLLVLHVLPG